MSTAELAEATRGFYKEATIRGIETGHSPASEEGIRHICAALPDSANVIMTIFKTATIDTGRGANRALPRSRSVCIESDMLVGKWHTLWQTSRDGLEAALLEEVTVSPKSKHHVEMKSVGSATWRFLDGSDAPPDTMHFAWRASCELLPPDRIGGRYTCITRRHLHGLLWLELTAVSETMVGYWLGDTWDSSTMLGLLVLGRSLDAAEQRFEREREAQSVLTLPVWVP